MIDIVLEMHWSNNPIPLDQLKSDPDFILDIPLGLFTALESPVKSVNGLVGDVVLNAMDVSADPVGAAQAVLETLDTHKLDKIDYVQHFRGLYDSFADLIAAIPIGTDGDYAQIKESQNFGRLEAIWSGSILGWSITGANASSTTDTVAEGNNNLYFKTERVLQTPMTGLPVVAPSKVLPTDELLTAIAKLQAQLNPEWVDISTLAGTIIWNGFDLTKTKIEFAKINGMIWIRGVMTILGSSSMGTNAEIFKVTDTNWLISKLTNTIDSGMRGFFQFMTSAGATIGSAYIVRADGYPYLGISATNRSNILAGNTVTIFPTVIGIANS